MQLVGFQWSILQPYKQFFDYLLLLLLTNYIQFLNLFSSKMHSKGKEMKKKLTMQHLHFLY